MRRILSSLLALLIIFNLVTVLPLVQAEAESSQKQTLLLIDFDQPGSEEALIQATGDESKLELSILNAIDEGKSNGEGAQASGNFLRIAAEPGENVFENIDLKQEFQTQAVSNINQLYPGAWDVHLVLDFDVVNRGDATRPQLVARFYGSSAVTGENDLNFLIVPNGYSIARFDQRGDNVFSRFTEDSRLYLYDGAKGSILPNSEAGNNQFFAGTFKQAMFRIETRNTPESNPAMVYDFDEIEIFATPVINHLLLAPTEIYADEVDRQIRLQWDNDNTVEGEVIVLRREAGSNEPFRYIGEVSGEEQVFLDTEVATGVLYHYQLRFRHEGEFSNLTPIVNAALSVLESPSLIIEVESTEILIGQETTISGQLSYDNGIGIEGVEVNISFSRSGDTYLDTTIGSRTTDTDGSFSIEFKPPFAGIYQIQVVAESIGNLEHVQGELTLQVQSESWESAPVVYRTTDAVLPGDVFTLYGGGLFEQALKVVGEPIQSSHIPSLPPSSAEELTLAGSDPDGHYVNAVLPSNAEPGGYAIWVKNEYGWSEPSILNGARALWMNHSTTNEQVIVKVIGRNMDAREFNANTTTAVRLSNGITEYEANVVVVEPFAVDFVVPAIVPAGEYEVSVSNDGWIWSVVEDGRRLQVEEPVSGLNPFELNVAWAGLFNWEDKFDVTDYGAVPNDAGDDTAAFQAAIDAAKTNGGGVAYVPDGSYRIRHVGLPADVLLIGESQDGAVLVFSEVGEDATSLNMIESVNDGKTEGRNGVLNLTIRLDEDNPDQLAPDHYIWIGEQWGRNVDVSQLRTARYIVVKNVTIDVPYEFLEGRGFGGTIIAKGDVVIADNILKGWNSSFVSNYITEYSYVVNNEIDVTIGNISNAFSYGTMTGNRIQLYWDVYDTENTRSAQGIFTRGPVYIADNEVKNTGNKNANDGEAYATEPFRTGTKMFGHVMGAGSDTISVNPKLWNGQLPNRWYNTWGIEESAWLAWYIIITDGKGLGQYREIIEYDGNHTYTVRTPWDIEPDATSKFVIMTPSLYVTMYNNLATDTSKGYWLYGDTLDGVIADNIGVNTEGAYVRGIHLERLEVDDIRHHIAYFSRIDRNVFSGVGTKTNVSGIGLSISLEHEEPFAYYGYGLEIRHNQLTGDPDSTYRSDNSEAPDINGIYVVHENRRDPGEHWRPVVKGVIISDNQVSHSDRGISLSGTGYPNNTTWVEYSKTPAVTGVVIKDNLFYQVEQEIVDTAIPTPGVVFFNTEPEEPEQPVDREAPFWKEGSHLIASQVQTDQISLQWPEADDNVTVTEYLVKVNGELVVAVNASVNTYTVKNLHSDTLYRFLVTAVDAVGNESEPLVLEQQTRAQPSEPSWVFPPVKETQPDEEEIDELDDGEEEPSEAYEPVVFSDVADHWAQDMIEQAVLIGIINGYPDGTFMPDRPVTRAEFVQMLAKAFQDRVDFSPVSFTDEASIGQWVRDAVAWAVGQGIVTGYEDGSFRPQRPITRVEMTAMIVRLLGLTGDSEDLDASGFVDADDIPVWARGAVAAAWSEGLVMGRDDNSFAPLHEATRAEAVTLILRIIDRRY